MYACMYVCIHVVYQCIYLCGVSMYVTYVCMHVIMYQCMIVVYQCMYVCMYQEVISKADVLMSSHGFQSLLLLFQPSESLFVELFPYNYFIPTYFGDIQLSLR